MVSNMWENILGWAAAVLVALVIGEAYYQLQRREDERKIRAVDEALEYLARECPACAVIVPPENGATRG